MGMEAVTADAFPGPRLWRQPVRLLAAIMLLALAGYTALAISSLAKPPSGAPSPTPPVRMFENTPAGMAFSQDPKPMLFK